MCMKEEGNIGNVGKCIAEMVETWEICLSHRYDVKN